jgi:hypothetical protein
LAQFNEKKDADLLGKKNPRGPRKSTGERKPKEEKEGKKKEGGKTNGTPKEDDVLANGNGVADVKSDDGEEHVEKEMTPEA